MERRAFLNLGGMTLAGLAANGSWQAALAAAPAGSADARLKAVMDTILDHRLALDPQDATETGLDTGARAALRHQLDDRSMAGRARRLADHQHALASLEAVPESALSATGKRQRALAIYLEQQGLAPARYGITSAQRPFPVSQQGGAYFEVPDFLDSNHPVADAADAEAYLDRLAQFPKALDDEAAVQRDAATRGMVAPAWALDLALGQVAKLRAPSAMDSGLTQSLAKRAAAKGIAGDWAGRAAKIVGQSVQPALDRYAAMLRDVQKASPAGDGIWRVKDGDAIYALALKAATTTDMTPEEIHRVGLDQVAELTGRLDTLLKGAGYTSGTVAERLTALNTAPDQLYPNTDAGRAQLIGDLNAGVAEMRKHLATAFNDPPNDPLEIRRVAPEIQDGAPNGYYYRAPFDGSRPAIYWINLKDTADWPRYQLPDLTYHEGIPGHHLQLSYVRHAGEMPMLLRNLFISAYGEGWALYAEQLAAELGMMPGLIQAGYLQSLLFRATRLVVDTGIHAKRWTRAQATDYMVGATGMTRPRTQREIDRYCTMIGQACSYKIGHNTWVRLRAKAQAALGAKFTLPWFHDVLKEGIMPLSMLETRIDERIAEALKA